MELEQERQPPRLLLIRLRGRPSLHTRLLEPTALCSLGSPLRMECGGSGRCRD